MEINWATGSKQKTKQEANIQKMKGIGMQCRHSVYRFHGNLQWKWPRFELNGNANNFQTVTSVQRPDIWMIGRVFSVFWKGKFIQSQQSSTSYLPEIGIFHVMNFPISFINGVIWRITTSFIKIVDLCSISFLEFYQSWGLNFNNLGRIPFSIWFSKTSKFGNGFMFQFWSVWWLCWAQREFHRWLFIHDRIFFFLS